MKRIVFAAAIAVLTIVVMTPVNPALAGSEAENNQQKAVLVTGASSGIGLKITRVLAANGYFVYAGARKQKDLDALNAMENVQSLRLDVTKQDEINAAVATVKKGGKGLYALVNNAGVFIGGPLIEVDLEEFKWLMDVNVYGPYRMTQAFAPMIIEQKGRITTVGSIAGILSGQFSGQYSMSKHAIEAYTDSLATEMERFDVKVSVIEPGNYKSKIALSAGARMIGKDYVKEGSSYAEEVKGMQERMSDRGQYKEPDEVAEAAMHALFDPTPKRRYMVVPNQEEASWSVGKAMQEMVQLNEGQAYSYSRDQLIEMLDATMNPKTE
ncbi:MAG: SDR family NAD(P)-dependent oxidoreductase [Xanthomonadales bacterium]|nr:SDR family NAD(P)-dependent oxidoreductase [Xanthomonadales bacterium]